ncbi:chitotriosidase-1-like [Aedes albopictus]|uniref:Chitinase n=1 Tax=Aedes albopictus TaxID=7160 RepID=A0ABM1Z3M4_AEDAL
MKSWVFRVLVVFGGLATLHAATDKVVCYFGSWATYRVGNGKFSVEDINPKLCTHIIYSFVGLDATTNTVKSLDTYNDITLQALQRFVGLKSRNPSVKLMVAIGGWNEGSTTYSTMAASATLRKAFIDSVVSFLQTYKFDGFDVDWEYPTQRGGNTQDRANFVTLLSELKSRFSSLGYILSIAVGASKDLHSTAYNVPEINKYVDFVNLMTYDFHASWDGKTGHNAPLYAASWEGSTSLLNVDAAVRGWLDDGLAASKLIMGIPVYAQTYTLASSGSNGVGASTTGAGTAGPYTQQAGMLSYLEVCERLKTGYTIMWDDVQKVPYAFSGNQWMSFDDVTSIGLKVAYAKSKGLGGVMVWSIESDDDQNICGGGAYPIIGSISAAVMGGSAGTSTTTKPSTTTTKPAAVTTTTTAKPTTTVTTKATTASPKVTTTTTTTRPAGTPVCKNGFARDPTDCRYFYQCTSDGIPNPSWRSMCPAGTYFDESINACNWQNLVSCP